MNARKRLLSAQRLDITLSRLCQQLIENHGDFGQTVWLGLQPRGVVLATRLSQRLAELTGVRVPLGLLDATFYRDDFRRREAPLRPNATQIPFLIEDRRVVLIDDVLYTGRTVRAALDAMSAFGRPAQVELLVLIDRKYARHLPIAPHYVGLAVHSVDSQRVVAEWREQGHAADNIWLADV